MYSCIAEPPFWVEAPASQVTALVGEDTVLVAVHVRRTDFAEYSLKFNKGEHSGLLNTSFYTTAMEHVRARHQQPVRFIVLREGNTYNLYCSKLRLTRHRIHSNAFIVDLNWISRRT